MFCASYDSHLGLFAIHGFEGPLPVITGLVVPAGV